MVFLCMLQVHLNSGYMLKGSLLLGARSMHMDSRDRFGTPLDQRFNCKQIKPMILQTGLIDIQFTDAVPYWCALGVKVK